MKKSILFLPRWYPNKLDIQLGTFIQQQAQLMADDFDVSVIYVQAVSEVINEFEIKATKCSNVTEFIVYFKSSTGFLGKLKNAKRYKKGQQIAFEKLGKKFDLCHVHVPYRSAFLALKLLRDQSIPFLVTEHWSGHLNGEFSKKNWLDKILYKRVLKKAVAISCVSELLQKKFKENTGFDSVVIPNYIETNPVDVESEPTHKLQLLSVSDMIDSVKNVSGLINAFSEALKINPNLHLTLIGGGPDKEKILDLIADLNLTQNISFRGRLAHSAVLIEMNCCHFYICNSNFETFGMAVAEALRAGKPVISTKCGGPEEFLNLENSILVEPKNNDQLKNSMLKMAIDFENYNAESISQNIKKKYGGEAVKKMWVNFYNSF